MHGFDFFALECFIAVAETGSFTRGSERIKRTQSAVSQQIAKLESQINKQLFIRGKILKLSPEGELFYSYSKKIYSLQRELIDHLKKPALKGEVKFGLPEDFANLFLTDVLAEYVRIYPNVILNIECDLTMNLLDRFKNKEFDLVLLKMSRPEDFPDGVEVWSEKLEWVANKKFYQNIDFKKPIPLVLSPKPCVYRSRAIKALDEKHIDWQLTFSSSSYASKIAAVKAGLGITVLPKIMVPPELKVLEFSELPKLSDTHLSLIHQSKNNPCVSSFEEFILQKLKY